MLSCCVVLCAVLSRHVSLSWHVITSSRHCVAPPCASHHTRFVWLVVASLRCALSLFPLERLVARCCRVASCHVVSLHLVITSRRAVFVGGSGLVGYCASCPQPLVARCHVDVDALNADRFHIQLSSISAVADMLPTCQKTWHLVFLHNVGDMSAPTFHVRLLGGLADMPTYDICLLRVSSKDHTVYDITAEMTKLSSCCCRHMAKKCFTLWYSTCEKPSLSKYTTDTHLHTLTNITLHWWQ